MRRFVFLALPFVLILALVPLSSALSQRAESSVVKISAPPSGTPLQGMVTITGTVSVDGLQSWEITFGYADDATGTWFLIDEGNHEVQEGQLGIWDTTTITDGDYNLRLTAYLEDGKRAHFVIRDLRVRNYSPIETSTPVPSITATPYTETPLPSQTPTLVQPPTETPVPNTPTPLPTNPATISKADINNGLLRGIAGALAIFVLGGLYLSIKQMIRQE